MWFFVIAGVIFALYATAEENVERLHSEEFKILLKKLEDKDQRIQSLEDRLQEKEDTMRNFEERLSAVENTTTSNVGFIVTATKTNGYIPTGVITFYDKVIDPSNAFNIQEGKLIVPSSGNYLFFFNSHADDTSLVHVYVNGNEVYEFYESIGVSGSIHQHNFMFTSKLEEGDELWLYNYYSDTLWNDHDHAMTFVGYKTN